MVNSPNLEQKKIHITLSTSKGSPQTQLTSYGTQPSQKPLRIKQLARPNDKMEHKEHFLHQNSGTP